MLHGAFIVSYYYYYYICYYYYIFIILWQSITQNQYVDIIFQKYLFINKLINTIDIIYKTLYTSKGHEVA